jgi:Domain of unknown function (DUF4829)
MKSSLLLSTALLVATSLYMPSPAAAIDAPNSTMQELAQQPTPTPAPGAVRVLYDYFQAIAAGNYQTAYNLHTPEYRAQVPYDQFVQMYQGHIGSISIQSVEPLPTSGKNRKEFRLEFNVSYIKPFPVGNGRVPEFFVLVPPADAESEWLIDGMAPGP